MLKKIIVVLLTAFNFTSCVTYIKNLTPDEEKASLSEKYKDQTLKVYFVNSSEADLQNVELFRELILEKKIFNEVLLVQSDKIESCTGRCVFFENKKSGLSVAEKLNMGAAWLTLGIIPTRFTNIYSLKNRYGHVEDIELVYWGSAFLLFYVGNKSFDRAENQQLNKLQQLLDKAEAVNQR